MYRTKPESVWPLISWQLNYGSVTMWHRWEAKGIMLEEESFKHH